MEKPESILVLKSGSCNWRGCMFCGYGRIVGYKPTEENVKKDFDLFFQNVGKDAGTVKVFGSGSFLDEKQVPASMRRYFIEKCAHIGVKNLVIESRPEHITESKLAEFRNLNLTVAIGLEAADDLILEKINKGFKVKDFEEAVEKLKKAK
ncbi:MAG: radical SAM protein, partial [Candidatus Altiarchaeales archaeon]|nr:radical SAM protein [Candidatus Altiarchaeales archaeon]